MSQKGEQGDEDMADVRLLFDEYEPKVTKVFTFGPHVTVNVVCAEQTQPGALQSGIFLWPAANALSKYLVEACDLSFVNVIELGAGCGLVGLVAASLMQQCQVQGMVMFTDRDWTSLKIIRQSVKATGGFGTQVKIVRKVLLWRETDEAVDDDFKSLSFDLALGSDLVYSTESARALLATVNRIMPVQAQDWRFLLSSSFRHPETTEIIDEKCRSLGLVRRVLCEDFDGCLIEEYRRG